ncbi:MAG TPA: carbohydrate kinase family protein, partial [Actinomycetota bacterium]|nr:carbohydrate kinase family protein [Actinomycetota bacterium]
MVDFDLLVLGDANPDLIVQGDVAPEFGQAEKLVDRADLVIGGSGAIAACGAARLGLRVAFSGVVGEDVFGRFMLDALAERDVDTQGLVMDSSRRTGLSIVLSKGEDRATLTALGAIADLRDKVIDRDLLRSARHVHVSSYFLQAALAAGLPALFREAHEAGASTSIDPNWDPADEWDGGLLSLLSQTDCFLPNSVEARAITGMDDIDVAALTLAERGSVVAVKFGQGGG